MNWWDYASPTSGGIGAPAPSASIAAQPQPQGAISATPQQPGFQPAPVPGGAPELLSVMSTLLNAPPPVAPNMPGGPAPPQVQSMTGGGLKAPPWGGTQIGPPGPGGYGGPLKAPPWGGAQIGPPGPGGYGGPQLDLQTLFRMLQGFGGGPFGGGLGQPSPFAAGLSSRPMT